MHTQLLSKTNEAFHRGFFHEWNSGVMYREYEIYSRMLRQSMGLDTYQHSERFITKEPTAGLKETRRKMKELGFQFTIATKENVWFQKVVDNVPLTYGQLYATSNVLETIIEGEEEDVLALVSVLNEQYSDHTGISVDTLVETEHDEVVSTYIFPGGDQADPINYPWMKDIGHTPASLIEAYLASKQSVLFLIGPKGTGKSTFGRDLLLADKDPKRNRVVVSDSNIVLQPTFSAWLLRQPSKSTIFIEDADILVAPREDGNSVMAALLNVADGVVPNDIKLVISTNLPNINKVDTALLRHGRCHRVLEFRELTCSEANAVRAEHNLPPHVFSELASYSLAEVFNPDADESFAAAKSKATFGFGAAA